MKLTGWYQPDQKPVRVGWYERIYGLLPGQFVCLDFWDGKKFKYGPKDRECLFQKREWRGIAK